MNEKKIYSFDGTEVTMGFCERPEKYNHLFQSINKATHCIPRGSGLSYCSASSGNGVMSIDMTRFNRIVEFNEQHGIIKVEAGIKIGDLIRFIIHRGWNLTVIPGYPSITVGGCVAFNVHGKSQFNIGTFGDHIKELAIYHPKYGEMKCSENMNRNVFDLTVGGFGLTGVILNVTLALSRLQGRAIIRKKVKCSDLSDAIDQMGSLINENDYVYSWNNLSKTGRHFGEGIIYCEKVTDGDFNTFNDFNYLRITSDSRRKFGINLINGISAELINYFYCQKEFISGSASVLSIRECLFPIYGKEIYYFLFGSKGLREYQVIVPDDSAIDYFNRLLLLVKKYNIPITLGSLKIFRGVGKYLNFCQDGICLAIDVPASTKSGNFFSEIDDLTISHNGIPNLSKDSRIQAKAVSDMYQEYDKFKNDINEFDPKKVFTSSLRQRLDV